MTIDKEYYFKPEAVVENRWDRKTLKSSYSPEVAWYGLHYIVGEPQPTHELALAIAEKKATDVKEAMLNTARPLLAGFKIAKE